MSAKQTIGIDVGDKYSYICVLNQAGEIEKEIRLKTTVAAFTKHFTASKPARIALETGTHSPWISRLLSSLGHEVLVGNARKLRMIYASHTKTDTLDARNLAKVARFDPSLLSPIHHKAEQSQAHLAIIRSRDALVATRTGLINHVRGTVKAFGARLVKCDSSCFHKHVKAQLPENLEPALLPVLEILASLDETIKAYDKRLAELAKQSYPEAEPLRQIKGVGLITALAFVLTLEDASRFKRSRSVGAFLGLTPGKKQSGERDLSLAISKQGDTRLRSLLVQCAQYIMGQFGEDCDLRRYGETIKAKGGAYAKQRAVVAVARKLAVLLHHLWSTGEVYDPLFNHQRQNALAA